MVRFLNTIIKFSMMGSLVLRERTGKFLGPAERLLARYLSVNPYTIKDGFEKSSQDLRNRMLEWGEPRPNYFRNLALASQAQPQAQAQAQPQAQNQAQAQNPTLSTLLEGGGTIKKF